MCTLCQALLVSHIKTHLIFMEMVLISILQSTTVYIPCQVYTIKVGFKPKPSDSSAYAGPPLHLVTSQEIQTLTRSADGKSLLGVIGAEVLTAVTRMGERFEGESMQIGEEMAKSDSWGRPTMRSQPLSPSEGG